MNVLNKHIAFAALALPFLLVLFSCSGRPSGVMSTSEMTDFLVDLHKLDGTLSVMGLGSAQDRENLYYYNSLLNKYGITEAEFDSSLVWYSKKPKVFEKIYSKVNERLTEMDSLQKVSNLKIQNSKSQQEVSYNIWNNRTTLTYNQDSTKGLRFSIKGGTLLESDLYKLILRIKCSGNINNQYVVMRLHYANGEKDSVKTKVYSDNILRRYSLKIRAKQHNQIDSISGVICQTSGKVATFKTKVDSICLLRVYIPSIQDSLMNKGIKPLHGQSSH